MMLNIFNYYTNITIAEDIISQERDLVVTLFSHLLFYEIENKSIFIYANSFRQNKDNIEVKYSNFLFVYLCLNYLFYDVNFL